MHYSLLGKRGKGKGKGGKKRASFCGRLGWGREEGKTELVPSLRTNFSYIRTGGTGQRRKRENRHRRFRADLTKRKEGEERARHQSYLAPFHEEERGGEEEEKEKEKSKEDYPLLRIDGRGGKGGRKKLKSARSAAAAPPPSV